MRERMSAARLEHIEWAVSMASPDSFPGREGLELIAELREVTRERDEALTEAQEYRSTAQHWKQERDEAYNIPPLGEYRAVCEERDALRVELKEMQDRYYEIRRVAEEQRASLHAEVEKCRTQLGDLHMEHGALRAELAKYKAVADAASAARDAFEAYGDDPNPETGKAHILATIKLSKALLALAPLDAKHECVPWRGAGGELGKCIYCGDRKEGA